MKAAEVIVNIHRSYYVELEDNQTIDDATEFVSNEIFEDFDIIDCFDTTDPLQIEAIKRNCDEKIPL